MAWALDPQRPDRGRALVTWELPTVATHIKWTQILPGDILLHLVPKNRAQEHVVLFQTWIDHAKTRAWIIEQSGHTTGMRRRTITVSGTSPAYQPYRYRRII